VSAFTFLLFGKDSLGRSDFAIKTLDNNGNVAQRGIEHTVSAELNVDGETVILKKSYSEKFVKQRGKAETVFSGHTTQHFYNGVPVQEKEYKDKISEIAGSEETFKLLTSPTVFPNLPWQKQRTLLLEVCGDISDADVIISNSKLSALPAILGKRSLEDHRKIVTARRSEINKEMEKIPVRIDEVRRGIPDVTGIDRGEAEKQAQGLETALNDAKLRLQGIDTGGSIADLTKRLSGVNFDLHRLENEHRTGVLATLNRLNQQISEVEAKVNGAHRRLIVIEGDLKSRGIAIGRIEGSLQVLRERWTAADGNTFKDTTSFTCPACGQALPSDEVKEAREKALSAFNQRKAESLKEIQDKGTALKEEKERMEEQTKALKVEQDFLAQSLSDLDLDLKQAQADRDALKRSSEDFSGLQNRAELLDEIEDLEAQIKTEREGKAQDIEKIKAEMATLEIDLSCAKGKVDLFTRREQGEKRIEELKVEEKTLAKEFEKLEGEIYLIEQFIKTKVAMLTDRINGKFEMVRFKLFNVLINGGIEDCCEITVNGVPFNAGLNNAARIQAGCDIIRTLQEHFKMKAPVFCDNRESVSELPAMGCQLVSLVVSPKDKTLRVTYDSDLAEQITSTIGTEEHLRSN